MRTRTRTSRRLASAIAAGLILLGCASSKEGSPLSSTETYEAALARTADTRATFAADSPEARAALARVQSVFAALQDGPAVRARVAEAYAPDAWFNDTLKTLRGSEAIAAYFGENAGRLVEGHVEFDDAVLRDGEAYLRWRMTLRLENLGGGEPLRSIGMTHLRFDPEGRVILHQDFWDSSAGFYEHVPVLGWVIRRIKGRL